MTTATSLEGLAAITLISVGLVLYGRSQNKEKPDSGNAVVSVGALGLAIAFLWFLDMVLF